MDGVASDTARREADFELDVSDLILEILEEREDLYEYWTIKAEEESGGVGVSSV